MIHYGAQAFKIAFTEAMLNWYKGGETVPDPRSQWEYNDPCYGDWLDGHRVGFPNFNPATTYRWKPAPKRTVVIDGVELVAPEIVAPAVGTECFSPALPKGVYCYRWSGNHCEQIWLKEWYVFLTREDCQAMSDAQRKQRLGETK